MHFEKEVILINYIKAFNKITGQKLPENVAVINCENDDEFLIKVHEWGKQCSIPISILHESEKASGVHIYSPSEPDAPSAVIINSAKIYREKNPAASLDYATDIIVFHELGHSATKSIFKGVCITSKKEIFPSLVLKESLACYYSYLCISHLYEQDNTGTPGQNFVEDMNFFTECMKESVSSYTEEDGFSFLLSPTDVGNIIGQILVYCKPLIDSSSVSDDYFSKCTDPDFAAKLYEFACVSFDIIVKNKLSLENMADYCNKFDIIASLAENFPAKE